MADVVDFYGSTVTDGSTDEEVTRQKQNEINICSSTRDLEVPQVASERSVARMPSPGPDYDSSDDEYDLMLSRQRVAFRQRNVLSQNTSGSKKLDFMKPDAVQTQRSRGGEERNGASSEDAGEVSDINDSTQAHDPIKSDDTASLQSGQSIVSWEPTEIGTSGQALQSLSSNEALNGGPNKTTRSTGARDCIELDDDTSFRLSKESEPTNIATSLQTKLFLALDIRNQFYATHKSRKRTQGVLANKTQVIVRLKVARNNDNKAQPDENGMGEKDTPGSPRPLKFRRTESLDDSGLDGTHTQNRLTSVQQQQQQQRVLSNQPGSATSRLPLLLVADSNGASNIIQNSNMCHGNAKLKPWSFEEDESLRKAVTQMDLDPDGENKILNWAEISKQFPERNRRQVFARWTNHVDPSIKKGLPWSFEEDEILREAVTQLGLAFDGANRWGFWVEIAKQIPGRTSRQSRQRWIQQLAPSLKKGPWSAEEQNTLCRLHAELGNKWTVIARGLPGRTWRQVRKRWNDRLDSSHNKGPWSEEEDEKLRKAVTQLCFVSDKGSTSWIEIAEQFPGRNAKQARERWRTVLDPSIKKGPWSSEEHITLRSL
jgi:hypothetical protein